LAMTPNAAVITTPNADYTLVIVGVVAVLAIILAALLLRRRGKK
jgi:LPXTG-motif cell wall-anchored protein